MADVLSADDIASIQDDVAPAAGDELVAEVEVWRMPANADGVVAGGAGVDQYGDPVVGDVSVPSSVPVLVATYPARISNAGVGAEVPWGSQDVNVNKYTVTINWALNPDIQGGDYLMSGGRRFEVIDPGGDTTYKVVRMVKVQEVKS